MARADGRVVGRVADKARLGTSGASWLTRTNAQCWLKIKPTHRMAWSAPSHENDQHRADVRLLCRDGGI